MRFWQCKNEIHNFSCRVVDDAREQRKEVRESDRRLTRRLWGQQYHDIPAKPGKKVVEGVHFDDKYHMRLT